MTEQADPTLSQSRLGDYVRCPRYYEFKRIWGVKTPDETIRYLRRGTAMHNAIEATWLWAHPDIDHEALDEDDPNPIVEGMGDPLPVSAAELRAYGTEALEAQWADVVPLDAYQTRSHYDFDRAACRAAIEAYFGEEGAGVEHFERAIGSEAELTFEWRGFEFRGYLDLILRTDSGLHVIDFKSSFSNIISASPRYASEAIEDHRDAEKHRHQYMKSLMQAALYRRAAEELTAYEPEMEIDFSFYALREEVETTADPEGVRPEVTGDERELTHILDMHGDDAWELIEQYANGIRTAEFTPEPWELIEDTVCDECPYREMCPDYLASGVSYLD